MKMLSLIALIILFFVSTSLQAGAKTVEIQKFGPNGYTEIWKKDASNEGYEKSNFKKVMTQKGYINGDNISVEGLCYFAYHKAVKEVKNGTNVTAQDYCRPFYLLNFNQNDSWIMSQEWMSKSIFTAAPWKLPKVVYVEGVTKQTGAKVSTPASASSESKLLVSGPDTKARTVFDRVKKLEKTLASLEISGQVSIRNQNAIADMKKELGKIYGTIRNNPNSDLEASVKALENDLFSFKRQIDSLGKKVQAVSDQVGSVAGDVAVVRETALRAQGTAEDSEKKINEVSENQETISSKINLSLVLAGITFSLSAGAILWFFNSTRSNDKKIAKLSEESRHASASVEAVSSKMEVFEARFGVLEKRIDEVDSSAKEAKKDALRASEEASIATELVGSILDGSAVVEFNKDNVPVDQLLDKTNEGEKIVWTCVYQENEYKIILWRDESTKEGLIKTSLFRNKETRQPSDPMSIKKLVANIVKAIKDGRVSLANEDYPPIEEIASFVGDDKQEEKKDLLNNGAGNGETGVPAFLATNSAVNLVAKGDDGGSKEELPLKSEEIKAYKSSGLSAVKNTTKPKNNQSNRRMVNKGGVRSKGGAQPISKPDEVAADVKKKDAA